jgi:hypothetical protein
VRSVVIKKALAAETSAVTVKRGEEFRLRFGAVIHSGPEYDAASVEFAPARSNLIHAEPRK